MHASIHGIRCMIGIDMEHCTATFQLSCFHRKNVGWSIECRDGSVLSIGASAQSVAIVMDARQLVLTPNIVCFCHGWFWRPVTDIALSLSLSHFSFDGLALLYSKSVFDIQCYGTTVPNVISVTENPALQYVCTFSPSAIFHNHYHFLLLSSDQTDGQLQ